MEYLRVSVELACDENFLFFPMESSQLYVIHGKYLNKTYSLVYAFFNDKKTRNLFIFIRKIKASLKNQFPKYLIMDTKRRSKCLSNGFFCHNDMFLLDVFFKCNFQKYESFLLENKALQ